jgi:pyrroline-5-carboxylate reductase
VKASRYKNAEDSTPGLKFIACIQSEDSKSRLSKVFEECDYRPEIMVGNNLLGAEQGDVVFVCCEPSAMHKILREQGWRMRQALEGKVLISVIGGMSVEDILDAINGDDYVLGRVEHVVRAIPNVAAAVRESMTVVQGPLENHVQQLVSCLFSMIGKVQFVPKSQIDIATTICASGPAFITEMILGLQNGAIDAGIDAKVALDMIAHMIKGTSQLVIEGQDPSVIQQTVLTPGGGTEVGLYTLARAGTQSTWANVVHTSSEHNVQKAQKLRERRRVEGERWNFRTISCKYRLTHCWIQLE